VTKGFEQRRSRGEFGAGLGWEPSSRFSVGVNYEFRLAQKQTSHAGMATFGVRF